MHSVAHVDLSDPTLHTSPFPSLSYSPAVLLPVSSPSPFQWPFPTPPRWFPLSCHILVQTSSLSGSFQIPLGGISAYPHSTYLYHSACVVCLLLVGYTSSLLSDVSSSRAGIVACSFLFLFLFLFFIVVGFVIHWNESAMGLHVFPILIPPPTSLSTLDNIHVSMLFSWNIPPSPSPTESKRLFYTSVSLFLFCI